MLVGLHNASYLISSGLTQRQVFLVWAGHLMVGAVCGATSPLIPHTSRVNARNPEKSYAPRVSAFCVGRVTELLTPCAVNQEAVS